MEIPQLRAQLRRAEREHDVERERLVAASLARALAKRQVELDVAVRLGRRAVLLGDESLRPELAQWHCQLGQIELAVGILGPLVESPGLDRSRLLMRIALYWARLGKAGEALSALREAAAYSPTDPLLFELSAMVRGWAPGATSAVEAADAYLRGAACRESKSDAELALEDRLRAFDIAPEHEPAARALAEVFDKRGHPRVADEIWRRHADALGELGGEVHRVRMQRALAAGDHESALAAALDARLDEHVDGEALLGLLDSLPSEPVPGRELDWLLMKLGQTELFAARLELAAEAAGPELGCRCRIALGTFTDRVLGSTERAVEQWLEAVTADPGNEAAKLVLRHYSMSTGDYGPLVEAYVRVGDDERQPIEQRLSVLRELEQLAGERLGDPALALWAVRRARALGAASAELVRAEQTYLVAAEAGDVDIAELERELSGAVETARIAPLKRLATLLGGRPERAERYRAVLFELLELRPDELRARRALERLLRREGDLPGLVTLWTRDLATAQEPNLLLRALLGLSRLERATGDLSGALAVLAAAEQPALTAAAAMQASIAAQLGDRRLRAEGLLRVLAGAPARLRALIASVASGELGRIGESAAAASAAELATQADPSLARAVVAYADAARGRRDRATAVAYERAMALSIPSSSYCRELVDVLEALGDAPASERWTARWLGLRPSETAAATRLIELAIRERDAARLGDVLSWAVAQAHPIEAWEAELARALEVLAEIDPARAGQMAWRMLDAFGPRASALCTAILHAADKAADLDLKIASIERELAACEGGEPGNELLWQLVLLHRERGDHERGYETLARALAAGVAADQVSLALELMEPDESPEAQFYRLELLAHLAERAGSGDAAIAEALRAYGAALWDLAKDREQAIAVWLRAAERDPERGWERLALDLGEVMGTSRALEEISRIAATLDRPARSAALLSGAGRVALERGARRQALQLGLLALDSEPASTTALVLVETAAGAGDAASVEQAYASALGAALGRYGERALHYRAARYFEQAHEQRAALSHALEAFRAVPSEGSALAMMERLVVSGEDAQRAAQAIEDVARDAPGGRARASWLRHAALVVARSEDGAQQRVEVLLKALVDAPDPELLELLGRAFVDLARQKPDGRQLGLVRFERAVAALLPRLEPPDGARVATAMASVALGCFGDAPLALSALAGAVRVDPEANDFAELVPDAGRLSQATDVVGGWLAEVEGLLGAPPRASLALLDLASEIACSAELWAPAARFLTLKSLKVPEDEGLRERARQVVEQSRDPDPPDYVVQAFPEVAERGRLLARAEALGAKGDRAGEIAALRDLMRSELGLPRELLVRLVKLAGAEHELDVAEEALGVAMASELELEVRVQLARGLASVMLEQRAPKRALALLERALELVPDDASLLTQALAAARASGDDSIRRALLTRLLDVTTDPVKKRLWFGEAWEVAKKVGDTEAQGDILRRWLESDPEDTTPLLRLEAECEAREAWAELAALLEQHLALALSTDERRRLGLKRAALLETKLGRLEEARTELSALCEQLRGDREVVERLAHITQQLGDRVGAAELWLSASALQATPPVAAEFVARAARIFLDDGDYMGARRALAAPQAFPRNVELLGLSVRLEREGGNEPRLARALEELGAAEEQPSAQRAAALLEAASLWYRLSELPRAVRCAAQAAAIVPHDGAAQLTACELEYRLRSAGSRDDALRTIERLRAVGHHWNAEQRNLVGFLLGEALEVAEGGDAALRELYEHERFGPVPLVSVAIAERLAKGRDPKQALTHFDLALKGDLRGFFAPTRVALSAARAALRARLPERAQQYLVLAEVDPELREPIALLREQLGKERSPSSAAPPPVAAEAAPAQEGGFATNEAPAGEVRAWARTTRIGLGDALSAPLPFPPVPPVRRPTSAPPPAPGTLPPPYVAGVGSSGSESSPPSDAAWAALTAQFRPQGPREEELFSAFTQRSIDAGQELVTRLSGQRHRVRDAVLIARMLVWLLPGEAEPLRVLKRAVEADHDRVFALALSQVVDGVLEGKSERLAAPALERQLEQPQDVRAMLFGDLNAPACEALAIVWQSAGRALVSHWAAPDLSAAEPAAASTPLGATYVQVARLLGMKRTPLLVHAESSGPFTLEVVLAAQPTLLARGEAPPPGARLAHELGAGLASILPSHVLIAGSDEARRTELLRAISAAFGPTEDSRATFASGARLAELLWEGVPPRAQRRLSELCASGALSREQVFASLRRAGLRAGLFASGDLGMALAMASDGHIDAAALAAPGRLAELCRQDDDVRDLVRLATSQQYAMARFRTERLRGSGLTRWLR